MRKFFLLVFILYLSSLSADSLAVKMYHEAVLKVKEKRVLEAHYLFKKVIKRSPYFVKGHFGIGKLYLYQMFDSKALTETVRLINQNKRYKNKEIIKVLGKAIIKEIKFLKSRRRKIREEDFNNVIIKKAIKELQIAVKLDRNYANAYFYLGVTYMFAQNYREALRQFKSAYQADKSLIAALYNSAALYEILNDKINALVFYKKYYYEKYLLKNNLDRKKYPFKKFIFSNIKI